MLDDPLTGEQTINGQEVYFDYKGIQIKGDFSGRRTIVIQIKPSITTLTLVQGSEKKV